MLRLSSLKMADVFAGLGGFHAGLERLGVKCVFACEVDPELRKLYAANFSMEPHHDIRSLPAESVPDHDVLCAGFPCQPFSKAGEQLGLACERDGDLFKHLLRIVRHKRPPFLMLENVANLLKHNKGQTWAWMRSQLADLGYHVEHKVLSPHDYGIPQIRQRLFVIGALSKPDGFFWPEPRPDPPDIGTVLDHSPVEAKLLPAHYAACLEVWQEFLDLFPADEELPSFPIWSFEFGATYPFETTPPAKTDRRVISRFRGSHGVPLKGMSKAERLAALPSYARGAKTFPDWKKGFIRQNRELYARHSTWIDVWLPKLQQFTPSLQKLEWNCRGAVRNLQAHIVQFRASGVRVKRSNWAPALIAMTTTQVPVIVRESRYMTVRECARLQGLGDLVNLPDAATRAYRALGNAVNADLVRLVGERLLQGTDLSSRSCAGLGTGTRALWKQ